MEEIIKSYTDLEQSKKLAEILPLESADMALCGKTQPLMTNYISAKKKFSNAGEIPIDPCWSLAALFTVLQNQCNILETRLRTNKKYNVFAIIGGFVYNSFEEHPDGIDIIDGLYELTLMLNKEKLL